MNSLDRTKPKGAWEVRRRIKIPAMVHKADAMALESRIGALPGVRAATADMEKQMFYVCYTVTATDYPTIINALENAGFPPLDNWLSRRRRSWFAFTENNARDNAKTPPSACCNKPPR